jgi:hypothetical protein
MPLAFTRTPRYDPITLQLTDFNPESAIASSGDLDSIVNNSVLDCNALAEARAIHASGIAAEAFANMSAGAGGSNQGLLNAIVSQAAQTSLNIAGATVADFVNQQLDEASLLGLGALGATLNILTATLAAVPEMMLVIAGITTKNLKKWLELRVTALLEIDTISQRLIALIRSLLPVMGTDLSLKQRKQFLQAIKHLSESLRYIAVYKSSVENVFKYHRGSIKQAYVYNAVYELDQAINILNDNQNSALRVDQAGTYHWGEEQLAQFERYMDEALELMNKLVNIQDYEEFIAKANQGTDKFLSSYDDIYRIIENSPIAALLISNLVITEYLFVIEQLVSLFTALRTMQNIVNRGNEIIGARIYGDSSTSAKTIISDVRSKLKRMEGSLGRQEGHNILSTSLGSGTEKLECVTKLLLAKSEMVLVTDPRFTGGANAGNVASELDQHINKLKQIINYIKYDYPKRGKRPAEQVDNALWELTRSFSVFATDMGAGRKKVLVSLGKFRIIKNKTITIDGNLIQILNSFNPQNSATIQILTEGYLSLVTALQEASILSSEENFASDLANKDLYLRLMAGMIDVLVLILAIVAKGANILGADSVSSFGGFSDIGLSQSAIDNIGLSTNQGVLPVNQSIGEAAIYWNSGVKPCGNHQGSDIIAAGIDSKNDFTKNVAILKSWQQHESTYIPVWETLPDSYIGWNINADENVLP